MLIYHPAYDAYHCIFRMLAIAEYTPHPVEVDKARILDFYLLFPAAVNSIRLPKTLKDARTQAKKLANAYHDPVNPAAMFRELRYIQEASLNCIAASSLIDREQFKLGMVLRTSEKIPKELQKKMEDFLDSNRNVNDVILKHLAQIHLRGIDGLKHRTMLMEHRYDVA